MGFLGVFFTRDIQVYELSRPFCSLSAYWDERLEAVNIVDFQEFMHGDFV